MNHQGKKRQRLRDQKGRCNKESSDPVEVFCRIKPCPGDDLCLRRVTDSLLQVYPPASSKLGASKELNCTFKYVFDGDCTQREIFEDVGLPLVHDTVQGKNCVLFTYGVTSSGKTYTMTGTPQHPGILPRSVDTIFESLQPFLVPKGTFRPDKFNGFDIMDTGNLTDREKIEPKTYPLTGRRNLGNVVDWCLRKKEGSIVELPEENDDVRSAFGVFVSYVEIYNERVFDLLQNESDPSGNKSKTVTLQHRQIRELHDERGVIRSVFVSGVTEVEVRSADEALAAFQRGQNIRQMAATSLNTDSSRSHAIFNIRLVQGVVEKRTNKILYDKELVAVSQLSLVDLAGSERAKRTNNFGERLKEAGCINNSLMTLRDCLESLRSNQKQPNPDLHKVVPYRDSCLTNLFRTYFKGEGRVRMLVCINPLAAEYGENLKVLEFAESTQEVLVARGPQVRFNDVLASGRRAAVTAAAALAEAEVELANELSRKRKVEEDAVDRASQRPFKYRYSSFMKQVEFDTTFINHQIAGHADTETLPALASFLEERIKRHKQQFADLKAQEEVFYELLCSIALNKQRSKQRIHELEKDMHAQRILSSRQSSRIRELEDQVNAARSIFQDVDRHFNSAGLGKELRDKISRFLRGDFPVRPPSHNLPEERLYPTVTAMKRARLRETEMDYSTTASSDNSPFTRHVTSTRGIVQTELGNAVPKTPRSRQEQARAPFNIHHPGKRRSKSADQRAIIQADKNHAPSGSVLKPDFRSRKVTNVPPSQKKLNEASDYYLIRQETDSNAEIENQLLHGKIIPTAGQPAGSSVVFDSIEKHRMDDVVLASERLNQGYFRPREASVSREEIQNRCAVSFSHKSPAKISPSKYVKDNA